MKKTAAQSAPMIFLILSNNSFDMHLSEEQIKDFQLILEEDFDEKISYDEASECAYGFLELGLAICERDAKMNSIAFEEDDTSEV